MKNLELINILAAGSAVISQQYENTDLKLKQNLEKIEFRFLNSISNNENKKELINEFVQLFDSLDQFSYKQFNFIFKAKIFQNQDQKRILFEKIKQNSLIYKKFQEEKRKSRRKRSLFTELQRLTVEDWIKKIEDEIKNLKDKSNAELGGSIGLGAGAVAGVITLLTAGPIGLLSTFFGWFLAGALAGGSITTFAYSTQDYNLSKSLTNQLDELKRIFRIIKTSNKFDLEKSIRERIKKIISNINQLLGTPTINFDIFDLDEAEGWASQNDNIIYLINSGY
ncbi:hypothetical protein [Mesomycoplasma ovipneumoniae]|uniref:hypothetical protein n=1 Tax=Mesomycoplasma ovipneumoniae TaxID=29562 RepID=UPI00311B3FC8